LLPSRKFATRMDKEMRAGIWKKRMGNLLKGKDVGIIGLGRIGKKTAKLLTPFGCVLSYYDMFLFQEFKDLKIKKLELDELLQKSDIITIHVSGKYDQPLLGTRELEMIKKGSWIVNVARGGVVDEKALFDALLDGRLAGAALDVFEEEPYDGPLKQLDNVILTPHIGSYAREDFPYVFSRCQLSSPCPSVSNFSTNPISTLQSIRPQQGWDRKEC